MTLVVHWSGGVRLLYTSVQNPWTTSIIASPPFCSASAVMAASSPAALSSFSSFSSFSDESSLDDSRFSSLFVSRK